MTIPMTYGGVERRLRTRTQFQFLGGDTGAFFARVAGTQSGIRVSCVCREINTCEGLVHVPACSRSEPCFEFNVTGVSRTSFEKVGSPADALVEEVNRANYGGITWIQFTGTYVATVTLGLAKFATLRTSDD